MFLTLVHNSKRLLSDISKNEIVPIQEAETTAWILRKI